MTPMPQPTAADLVFNGHCAEAMRFYERALSGKVCMPMQLAFLGQNSGHGD